MIILDLNRLPYSSLPSMHADASSSSLKYLKQDHLYGRATSSNVHCCPLVGKLSSVIVATSVKFISNPKGFNLFFLQEYGASE